MKNNLSLSVSTVWSCSICMPCFFPFSLSSSSETIYKRNSLYMMSPSWNLKSIGTIDTKCAVKHSFVFLHSSMGRNLCKLQSQTKHVLMTSWFLWKLSNSREKKCCFHPYPPTSGNRHIQLLFSQKGVCWSTPLILLVSSSAYYQDAKIGPSCYFSRLEFFVL